VVVMMMAVNRRRPNPGCCPTHLHIHLLNPIRPESCFIVRSLRLTSPRRDWWCTFPTRCLTFLASTYREYLFYYRIARSYVLSSRCKPSARCNHGSYCNNNPLIPGSRTTTMITITGKSSQKATGRSHSHLTPGNVVGII